MKMYWIWLSQLKYIGPVLQKQLVSHFGTPKAVYTASEEELAKIPRMSNRAIQSIRSSRCLKAADAIAKTAEKNGISILAIDDEFYPVYARKSKEAPVILFYKGRLQPIDTAVGVVGSRRCSSYGKGVAKKIGEELAGMNIPVISGFAKGIDSYAQAACMRNGGYTIAFLGGGPDICYPSEQRKLYHEILDKGGAFLSQYPPGTPPIPKQFLQRNALISAWSAELVVVEAGAKSGALWTADFARKNGKQVYAVPNKIDSWEGAGTNLLLSQGVPPYLGIGSLQAVRKKTVCKKPPTEKATSDNPILQILSATPATISSLANQLKLDESVLMEQLFSLELDQKVVIRGNVVHRG